jgi:hypothetical protein
MLWSIAAKERTAQKVRLSRMVPPMVGSLRAGAAAAHASEDRIRRFLDALYELHIAAIKPPPVSSTAPSAPLQPSVSRNILNVHDFVGELVVGTWLAFQRNDTIVNAGLSWISPLHTTYMFTSRSNHIVFSTTPEDLAWDFSAGKVTLIVEPVPLFDRAVSVARDSLAKQRTEPREMEKQNPR